MPLWDTRCTVCGHEATDRVVWNDKLPACEACGGATKKLYTAMPHVRQDSIPGGLVIEHAGPEPRRVDSWSERRRYLKEMGVREKVEHKGVGGSDKSRLTQRWV